MTAENAPGRAKFPPQIKYIVGNEAAERFSYYGMTAILTLFMTRVLDFSDADATSIFHYFAWGVYLTPLLGAYLSDRFWGKYRTIMTLSLFYVAGHVVLAIWENEAGLYAGLVLLALGAGGIKPCVSAHVGDQFTESSKHLLDRAFPVFYMAINVGSLAAQIAVPITRKAFGYQVAFGIPAVLMAIAVFVFWRGRRYYVNVPPSRRDDTPGRVLVQILARGAEKARARYGERPVGDALAVARVALVMLPCLAFWALFMQTGSSWVLLTEDLDLHGFLPPDLMQSANAAMVMVMIPLFSAWLYPALRRRGVTTEPLRKMTWGMFVTGFSFVAVAALQALVDAGHQPSAFWMLVPYLILTAGEVLLSITALEFAYSQSPRAAKSTVMSLWYLTISFGNLLAAVIAKLNVFEGAMSFGFWAALMFTVAALFALLARRYQPVEFIESDEVTIGH